MLRARGIDATVTGDDAGGTAGVNLGAAGYRLEVPESRRAEAEGLLEIDDTDAPSPPEAGRRRPARVHVVGLLLLVVVMLVVVSEVFS